MKKSCLSAVGLGMSLAVMVTVLSASAHAQFDPQPLRMADHSRTAVQQPLAPSRSLLEGNGITIMQGEMLLWEAYKPPVEEPLGDVARRLRAENDGLAKAKVHWDGPESEQPAKNEPAEAKTPQSPVASEAAMRRKG